MKLNLSNLRFTKQHKMLLNITLCLFLISSVLVNAQKAQRIAYIDMEYILENVPEYLEAQNTLNAKVTKWRSKLDELSRYIEKIKTDLANERAILTNDLILDKEDEITLKQEELRRLESLYFGPKGDMFLLRKQLVKPIQDQVFNSIEGIVKKQKYDFVFDKSSDLVMLYSNKKYDISELILNEIVRERKIKANEEKRKQKSASSKERTEKQKKVLRDREALRKKKEEERKARQKRSEEIRKKRIAEIEEKRRILREKKESIKKKNNTEQDNN
ncbi:MAG: OmpH family outer membrane protein [Flavobacteriaceae bacterium]